MIYYLVSYISPILLSVVASVMVYRRLCREFPFFFTYILVVVTDSLIRFAVHNINPALPYFYAYWITEAVEAMLGFLVLYEVFLIRIFPGFKITLIYRRLFPVILLVVLLMTSFMFLSAPTTGPSKIVTIIGASTLALNFCQVAFLTFFGGLATFMSREIGRHELGIGVGFAVYGAVKLFVTAERAKYFYVPIKVDQMPTIAYLIAVAIWLFFLSKSDPEPELPEITEEMVDQAERVYGDVLPMLKKLRKKSWR